MRNLISIMLLIVCFALPSFAVDQVSKTPVTVCVDLDHAHSDFIATTDAIGVIVPVIFIGDLESAMVNSFTAQTIERLDRYEANKSSLNVIRNILEEGSSGDYSTFINNDIDNIQKELITKLNYSGNIEHRIRGTYHKNQTLRNVKIIRYI